MPPTYPQQALLASPLALLLLLGGTQAARQRFEVSRPQIEADRQYIQCTTALTLLHQNRGQEALDLLNRQAHAPLVLKVDSTTSKELTPSMQVLMLCKDLITASQKELAQGQTVPAQAYVNQCRILSHRIRTTSNEEMAQHLAQTVDQMTTKAMVSMGPD